MAINTSAANAAVTSTAKVASNIATGEQYITANTFVIPTTVANGTTYQIVVMGWQQEANSGSYNYPATQTFNLRLGPNGNLTDPVILTTKTPSTAGDLINQEFYVTVRSNGSSGNIVAGTFGQSTNVTKSNVVFNSGNTNILGVSHLVSGTSQPGQNTNIEIALIKQIL
jgi:hypothetical protein